MPIKSKSFISSAAVNYKLRITKADYKKRIKFYNLVRISFVKVFG